MAKNFGKKLHKLVAKGNVREKALELFEHYAKIDHARWIPIESLQRTGFCYLTFRQARALESWAKRKIKGSVKFTECKN